MTCLTGHCDWCDCGTGLHAVQVFTEDTDASECRTLHPHGDTDSSADLHWTSPVDTLYFRCSTDDSERNWTEFVPAKFASAGEIQHLSTSVEQKEVGCVWPITGWSPLTGRLEWS